MFLGFINSEVEMEPDELSALKLDEEFKKNLSHIRPHILSFHSVNGMFHSQ